MTVGSGLCVCMCVSSKFQRLKAVKAKPSYFFCRDSYRQCCGNGNNFYLIWLKRNRKQFNVLRTPLIIVISDTDSENFYEEALSRISVIFHRCVSRPVEFYLWTFPKSNSGVKRYVILASSCMSLSLSLAGHFLSSVFQTCLQLSLVYRPDLLINENYVPDE